MKTFKVLIEARVGPTNLTGALEVPQIKVHRILSFTCKADTFNSAVDKTFALYRERFTEEFVESTDLKTGRTTEQLIPADITITEIVDES